MANEIVLAPGATAEPHTCGSCKFFERKDYEDRCGPYGFCRIDLPKKFVTQQDIRFRGLDPKLKDQEYTGNEDQIADTDHCDLWKHSGKTYIVQRRIPPQ